MTNQEYTKKYHSLTNLHLEEGSLLRYVDGEGLNVGFVVDAGDAENEFGIEEYRSYPYNVIDNLNDRLKDKRLATIKYVINEKSLAYYVENFTSFAYQRLYEVRVVDLDEDNNLIPELTPEELEELKEDFEFCEEANRESSRGGK